MKTFQTMCRRLSKVVISLLAIAAVMAFNSRSPAELSSAHTEANKDQTIMLALLLDTSNSMDGLIDQAKSQLWKIVNELAAAKTSNGSRPNITIALYEYGNDGLPALEGYIRQVSPFTQDLDVISEKLFALTTNGGNEFCGHVIKTSLNQLAWSSPPEDVKMIFIAGNEPFTQGEVPYRAACSMAKEKNVIVNTIFCGNFSEGVESGWKTGAVITGGSYMSIEQNNRTVYIPTPYDEKIEAMNERLNNTYVFYGKEGSARKQLQSLQDKNAGSYGLSNMVERAVCKSSYAYDNSSWDLVDAYKEDETVISKAKTEDLPAEMKGMTGEQRKAYVVQKSIERANIQKDIQLLNKKRQEYILRNPSAESDAMLDAAMIKTVREYAKTKNLTW